jgi:perosamine synthetase
MIPLHEPSLSAKERRYVLECVDSGWVSSASPFVGRFERAVADYVGAPHAAAVASGSAALHLALQLAGVRPDDEVLISDLTFVAPVHTILQCGAHPVLIDADDSWQLDAGAVAEFLAAECAERAGATFNRRTGRRVRAIVAIHLLGLACAIDRLREIARRHRLALIEDAAQAVGVRYRGRHVGTFGDFGVLSFNGNKLITAGGGGMLLSADRRQDARARGA